MFNKSNKLLLGTLLFTILLGQQLPAQDIIPGEWDDRFFLSPGCDGSITASAVAPDGRLFLGGSFTSCNGVVANNLVIFDPVAQEYAAVMDQDIAGVNGRVYALDFDGPSLYVGGNFTQAGAISANNIARLDSDGWSRLGTEQDNGVTDDSIFTEFVFDLALVGSRLYVAGRFEFAGAIVANNIAVWENDQWSSLGSGTENGVNGGVNDLLPLGQQLVLGGTFTEAGSIEANRVALWTGSGWSSLGTGTDNGVGMSSQHSVTALETLGSDLVVAGRFDREIAGETRSNLVRWDGSSWQAFGAEDTRFSTDRVSALLVDGSDLYAGGSFSEMDNLEVNNLARWDGSAWHAVGALGVGGVTGSSSIAGGLNNGSVSYLAAINNGVLAGGVFSSADGVKALGVALFRNAVTVPLGPDEGLGVRGMVHAVTVFQDEIYIGGDFEFAGATRVNHIARFDGQQWQALDDGGFVGISSPTGSDYEVNVLRVYQNQLWVGGRFSNVADLGSTGTSNLIRWTGTQWNPLPQTLSGTVTAIAVHDGQLYVGGAFGTVTDGTVANRVAAFDGSVWTALENFLGNGVDGSVNSLVSHTDGLYVGGDFESAGGIVAEDLAVWDGSGFSSPADGPNGVVYSILADNDQLIVGGLAFSPSNGESSPVLSSFVDGGWVDPADLRFGFAGALLLDGDGLIIGGRNEDQNGTNVGIGRLGTDQLLTPLGTPRLPAFARESGGANAIRRNGNTLLVGGNPNGYAGVPVGGFSIFSFNTQVDDLIFDDRFDGAQP